MKVSTVFSLVTLFVGTGLAATAMSAAREAELSQECGDLHVMKVSLETLPQDIAPEQVRHCAEHPLGQIRPGIDDVTTQKTSEEGEDGLVSLKPRACWYGAPSGCSGGYCWKSCGILAASGEWCWTATSAGLGPWITCNTNADCNTLQACGIGLCSSCGCSC
jgi:hypothetical protein